MIFETHAPVVERPLNEAKSEKIAWVLHYWQEKKGARPFPARSDLNPREMTKFLSCVQIYDVVACDTFRARLLGTAVVNAMGKDLTGTTISPTSEHPVARRLFGALQRAMEMRAPVLVTSTKAAAKHAVNQEMETLIAPLSDDGQHINQLLCATVFTLPTQD